MINTVGELISALSKYPKDMKVYSNHITRNLAGQIIIDHENSPEEEEMERRLEEYRRREDRERERRRGEITSFANRW